MTGLILLFIPLFSFAQPQTSINAQSIYINGVAVGGGGAASTGQGAIGFEFDNP